MFVILVIEIFRIAEYNRIHLITMYPAPCTPQPKLQTSKYIIYQHY